MEQVSYLAPLKIESGQFEGFISSADVSVVTTINAGAVKEYLIGTVSNNYWGNGTYDRNVYFQVNDVEAIQEAAITEVGFDDWLLIAINGTTIYIGPYGGNTLSLADGFRYGDSSCDTPRQGGTVRWTCYGLVVDTVHWDGGTTYKRVFSGSFDSCVSVFEGHGDSVERVWICSNSTCPADTVQYKSGATTLWHGCGPVELKTEWRISTYLDIRPYLKEGQNHLFSRTIVGGKGEMWYRLRVRGCE
jgi:hypothetical protein